MRATTLARLPFRLGLGWFWTPSLSSGLLGPFVFLSVLGCYLLYVWFGSLYVFGFLTLGVFVVILYILFVGSIVNLCNCCYLDSTRITCMLRRARGASWCVSKATSCRLWRDRYNLQGVDFGALHWRRRRRREVVVLWCNGGVWTAVEDGVRLRIGMASSSSCSASIWRRARRGVAWWHRGGARAAGAARWWQPGPDLGPGGLIASLWHSPVSWVCWCGQSRGSSSLAPARYVSLVSLKKSVGWADPFRWSVFHVWWCCFATFRSFVAHISEQTGLGI
jgi:hypothetical protein